MFVFDTPTLLLGNAIKLSVFKEWEIGRGGESLA
jgi:hypothetical protein